MASIRKRTNSTGETSYFVEVRLKGHPAQRATFARKTDAKRWAQDTESAIRDGRHFKTAEAKRHTLGDLVDRYIRDVLPRPPRKSKRPRSTKSQQIWKAQLGWWKRELGDFLLADVTPAKIVECRDKLSSTPTSSGKPRSSSTVVRYMAPLSHAFGIAVREWGWLDDSPMRKVERPAEPDGRVRYLSDEERNSLLSACRESRHPWLYPIVVLAMSTGMRKGEIMSLRWPQVDLSQRRITLYRTKNGETRVVPLSGTALDLLAAHSKVRRVDTDLLWPSNRKRDVPTDLRDDWNRAIKTAGISDFRFHDLRHNSASRIIPSPLLASSTDGGSRARWRTLLGIIRGSSGRPVAHHLACSGAVAHSKALSWQGLLL